jgi:hypothetical protein
LYLKHLLTHRGLPAHDPRTGGILFMSEAIALDYVSRGLVQAIGSKRCIRELRWLGTPLRNVTTPEEAAGYKPSEYRPTKYSYDWETSDNPQNCWTLRRLSNSTGPIFRKVVTGCIAPFFDPDSLPPIQTHETT